MKLSQEFERIVRQEYPGIITNLIFRDDDGVYNVFEKYKIVPEKPGYRVYCSATDVGVFASTKNALSWCIADKYCAYNLARDILNLDNKLASLTADIQARALIADHSKNYNFRENIETKLETKLIHKKQVEEQLSKCVNWAKNIQSREFTVEKIKKR